MDPRNSILAWASTLVLGLVPAARAQTSTLTIDGTQPSQNFGWRAVDIGDVDGDGVGDLAIGSPGENAGHGAVHVHSGANGDLIGTALGPPAATSFGYVLAAVGDVDLDGSPDFAAGPSPSDRHVRVYSGSTGALLRDFSGPISGFGWSFDGIGDLDGDGAGEVLVGDPFVDGASTDQGVVHVFSGNTGAILHTLIAPIGQPSQRLGKSVSSIDDVDGDQVRDVVATSEGTAPGVFAFSGATGAFLYRIPWPDLFPSLLVDGGGDLDGDGRGDLVVSAWTEDAVRVFSGATGAFVRLHGIPCASQFFGDRIAMLGDVDNDGSSDYGVGHLFGHHLRVFAGASGQVLWDLARRDATSIAPTGDRDGDGRDDVVLALGSASVPGMAYVGRVLIAVDGVEPVAGVPSAFGDGTGAPCPCGNTGTPGAGCGNSLGIGASAEALGSTSFAEGNLHLVVRGIPGSHLGLLFRGTTTVNGGLGVPAGDGLRGAGGTLKRLAARTVCADPYVFEPYAQQVWIAGQSYTLQVQYRDGTGPCGSSFNMTNAVTVQVTP